MDQTARLVLTIRTTTVITRAAPIPTIVHNRKVGIGGAGTIGAGGAGAGAGGGGGGGGSAIVVKTPVAHSLWLEELTALTFQ